MICQYCGKPLQSITAGDVCTNPACPGRLRPTGESSNGATLGQDSTLLRTAPAEVERLLHELKMETMVYGQYIAESDTEKAIISSRKVDALKSRLLAALTNTPPYLSGDVKGWLPIETAPRDGTIFLAITDYGLQCTVRFNGECFVRSVTCRRCDGMGLGGLTHWMPLPEPPRKAGE